MDCLKAFKSLQYVKCQIYAIISTKVHCPLRSEIYFKTIKASRELPNGYKCWKLSIVQLWANILDSTMAPDISHQFMRSFQICVNYIVQGTIGLNNRFKHGVFASRLLKFMNLFNVALSLRHDNLLFITISFPPLGKNNQD